MKSASDLLSSDFVMVDASDSVSVLIGRLVEGGGVDACVFDGRVFLGVFSHQKLLKTRVDINDLRLSKLFVRVPELRKSFSLVEVSALMFSSNLNLLPVVDGIFLGVVNVHDVFRNVRGVPGLEGVKVMDIRHPIPIVVGEDAKLNKAFELMHDNHIDRLPVVDGNGKFSGFLSYVDVIKNYYYHHLKRDESLRPRAETKYFKPDRPNIPALPVSDFMNKSDPITISDGDSVFSAAERMAEKGVLSLLIIDGGVVKSIVTKRDILEAVMQTGLSVIQNISFVGLDEIDVDDFVKAWVRKISSYHSEKLSFLIKNRFDVAVHIKEYSRAGNAHKYSVHVRASFPGGVVSSQNSHDWDLRRAVHKGFIDVGNKLSHRFKRNIRENHSIRKIE